MSVQTKPGTVYMILGGCWILASVALNVGSAAQSLAPGWFVIPPLAAAVGAGRFWLGLRQRAEGKRSEAPAAAETTDQ